MNYKTLKEWRLKQGLNKIEAAKMIGSNRNAIAAWEANKRPIPLYISLACAAIVYGLPPLP